MAEKAIECLAWIANPAREPTSIVFLVSMRVASLMTLFASMILWTLACIYRPWKLQIYKGDHMEIGVWRICRITPKVYECYDGWYEQHFKWWFVFYRYLMVTGIGVQLVTICFMVVESVRRKNLEPKPWILGCIGCFLAISCHFTSLILFYLKFEWEFAEIKFGWPIMGWNEETPDKPDYIETTGYPYIMAWVGLVVNFISMYLFYYTKCEEKLWMKSHRKKGQMKELEMLKLKAQRLMAGEDEDGAL